MRLSKTLDFGDGRTVVVKEPTVGMVRGLIMDWKSGALIDLLMPKEFASLNALSAQLVELPGGESLDSLSLSEVGLIWEALKELAPFFKTLESLGQAALNPRAPSKPGRSTSPSADIAESGNTGGVCSPAQ